MNNNIERKEEEIDIKKYLFKILRNWYWFVLSIFISLVAGYLITKYSTPKYRASTTMLVASDGAKNEIAQMISQLGLFKKKMQKNEVENEIPVLKSYTLARKVVEELNFNVTYYRIGDIMTSESYVDNPFYIKYDTASFSYRDMVTISLDKEGYELEYIDSKTEEIISNKMLYDSVYIDSTLSFSLHMKYPYVSNLKNDKYGFKVENLNNIALQYTRGVSVSPVSDKSSVLNLNIEGTVPKKIVDYLNKMTEVYIRTELDEMNKTYENTISFIDNQLSKIVDSLEIAEDNLEAFRRNNKIINLSQEGQALFEKIENIQEKKINLDMQMKYYNYLLEYIKSKSDFKDVVTPSVIGIQDPLLNSLIAQLSELYREKSLIEYSSQKFNPSLELINLKIANNKVALEENLNNVINGATIEQNEVNERLLKLNKEMQSLPATERRYVNIQRKFELNDNIYTFLLEKKAEAGMAKASNMPNAKIIDSAYLNNVKRTSPNSSRNLMIAFIIGFFTPFLMIIIKELLNNKILSIKEVEDLSDIPLLGVVPHSDKELDNVVLEHPRSAMAEAYRVLRFNIQYLTKGKDKIVLAVSSTISGEGKTFSSLNIASVYALAKKRTVLIGLDLRKPKLHEKFNVQNSKGITTIIIGNDKIEDCIVPISEYLAFIPSGPIAPNPAELIEAMHKSSFIEDLKSQYDVIVIDTPPLALVSDAMILQDKIDATAYVVRQDYSTKDVIDFVNNLNEGGKIANPAIVINDVKEKKSYGGYGKYGKRYGTYRYSYSYYENEETSLIQKFKKKFNL